MSLVKLGQADEAQKIFQAMVNSANESLQRGGSSGESADSSERQLSRRSRQAQLHYLAGLGYFGLGEKEKARQELARALESSPDHLGAKEAMAGIGR